MAWTSYALPEGMKNSEAERYDVSRTNQTPPVRVVDEDAMEPEDSPDRAKVYTSDEVQEQVVKFAGGSAEQALEHVRLFHSIMEKMDYEGTQKVYQSQLGDAQLKRSRVTQLGQEQRDLDFEIDECEKAAEECIQKAFQLFSDLLAPPLLKLWQKSVEACCKKKGWIDVGGIKRDTIAGHTFASLRRSIKHWLIAGRLTHDAAERQRRYVSTQLKFPQRAIGKGARAFADRFSELNQFIAHLPCLKDTEGAPPEMERADKPFSQFEMCNYLLATPPIGFSQMFWSRQQEGFFATDYGKLVDALEKIEPEYHQQQELMNKVRAAGGKTSAAKKMNSLNEKIPRKQLATPSGESSSKKQRRLCQLCSKYSPETKDSHNTKMCRKWNLDGTRKNGKQSARNVNMHGKSESSDAMLSCFMQMQKDQQKLIKMMASKKKKRAKKSRGYSSSDSSNSE